MGYSVKSTVRFAIHAIAFVAAVSLVIASFFVFGGALTAALGGLDALPQLLAEMPFVVVATFLPALTYSLLMELWYWRTKRRSIWPIVAFSSLAFSLAGVVGAYATDYVHPLTGRLILFSGGGALLGTFFGFVDYLAIRLRKKPNQPPEPTSGLRPDAAHL